jgi:ParB/RepB/Spo0J family partition protein
LHSSTSRRSARSPLNHRRTFDGIDELGADIKANGLKVPIKVRPVDDKETPYELVYGERRWRAAELAGVAELPALIQELTDLEVIKEQLVENVSRSDVHPLEEADGYKALLDEYKYTVEQIAAETGKSVSAVYARLKLCDLGGPKAREAFLEEKLNASIALLIARIPNAKLQDQATKEILEGESDQALVHGEWVQVNRPMSYREAQVHLQQRYMLLLATAPFPIDDAGLVKSAGACTGCLFRTGNQRELFDDVKSADVCTNPPCFAKKKEAHAAGELAKWKDTGKKTLPQKEVSKVFEKNQWAREDADPDYRLKYGTQYRELDEKAPYDIDQKQRPWSELFGGEDHVPVVLAKTPDGEVHKLIDAKAAREALVKAGVLKAPKKPSASSKSKEPSTKELIIARTRKKVVAALVEKIGAKAETGDIAFWRWLAQDRLVHSNTHADDVLAEIRGIEENFLDTDKLIKKLSKTAEFRTLAIQAMICHQLGFAHRDALDDDTIATCEAFKVDHEELASDADVEIKNELAAAAEKNGGKKSAKPAAKKPSKKGGKS